MTAKIAILATGDELTNGDIVNTNTQQIAHQLFSHGLEPGLQVNVSDAENEIITAMKFLLQQHHVLIITGGLGPTSDDRTRFALAKLLNRELVFNEESWQHIVSRHQSLGIKVVDSNKQQALFPENCSILFNPHGTACGCRCESEQHVIFMLPGPPHECLPMFNQLVLPELKENYASDKVQLKWKLFGVPEGEIAEKLDNLLQEHPCQTGYRWEYPYIEFKVLIDKNYSRTTTLQHIIENAVAPHIICPPDQTAIECLQELLLKSKQIIVIDDQATGGLLESSIKTPELAAQIIFSNEVLPDSKFFKLQGLENYWKQNVAVKTTELIIGFYTGHTHQLISKTYSIPFRNNRVRTYAVEYIAYLISQEL